MFKKPTKEALLTNRRICIYGETGAGKSYLAATAQDVPELSDVAVLDLDGGSATIMARGDVAGASARSIGEVEAALWKFARKDKEVAHIKTLILDGVSELSKRDLEDIATSEAEKNGKRDRDENALLDYRKSKARMLRILRMARDLEGINLIITLWAKKVYPSVPGTKIADKTLPPSIISPDISPSLEPMLGFVDDFWYLYEDGGSRYLATANFQNVRAKTRVKAYADLLTTEVEGQRIPVIKDPSFPKLFALYKQALGTTNNVKETK